MRLLKDYTESEYDEFRKSFPSRELKLVQFISRYYEFELKLDTNTYNKDKEFISVSLPVGEYKDDFGCAMYGRLVGIDGDKIEIVDSVTF